MADITTVSGSMYHIWQKTNATNSTQSGGFASRIPTVTAPTGDGVREPFGPGGGGGTVTESFAILPYGTGAAGTFTMRILGWKSTAFGGTALYIPIPLAEYSVTLGTATGIASADLDNTILFATTITCSYGPTWQSNNAPLTAKNWFQFSPGSNLVAMMFLETMGFRYIETLFNLGTATAANACWSKV